MARLLDLSSETIRHICDILTTGSPANRHDALSLCAVGALARTCQYTSDPALDALWNTIPSVAMLAWVMPRDLWSTTLVLPHIREEHPRPLSFARPPHDTDFVGIGRYAYRVRTIRRGNACAHLPRVVRALDVTREVLDALAARFPSGNLFPNLHHLEGVPAVGDPGHCWISTLFTPTLRTCNLYFNHMKTTARAERDLAHTFSRLAQLSPAIHNIHIDFSWSPEEGSPLVSRLISDFHFLRSVTILCATVNVRALLHLSTLPSLHALEVRIPHVYCEADWEPFETLANSEVRFPALRRLALKEQEPNLAICTTLINYIHSPILEEVAFGCCSRYGDLSETHVRDLFTSLCRMRASNALHRIHIDDEQLRIGARIHQDTLRSLLSLSGLTHITINICQPTMVITDALLRDMAMTWPNLEVLELGVTRNRLLYDELPRPEATLAGLLPFTCGCPSLTILGFEFRTDIKLLPKALLDGRPSRGAESKLQHLYVGLSTVEDTMSVAAFLSDAFPVLEGIWSDWPRVKADRAEQEVPEGVEEEEEEGDGQEAQEGNPQRVNVRRAREEAMRDKWQDEVFEAMCMFGEVREEERLFAVANGKRQKPAIERKDLPLLFDFIDR